MRARLNGVVPVDHLSQRMKPPRDVRVNRPGASSAVCPLRGGHARLVLAGGEEGSRDRGGSAAGEQPPRRCATSSRTTRRARTRARGAAGAAVRSPGLTPRFRRRSFLRRLRVPAGRDRVLEDSRRRGGGRCRRRERRSRLAGPRRRRPGPQPGGARFAVATGNKAVAAQPESLRLIDVATVHEVDGSTGKGPLAALPVTLAPLEAQVLARG
jgi:hypothetical protein